MKLENNCGRWFTIKELVEETGLEKDEAWGSVCSLISKGIIEKHPDENLFRLTKFGLVVGSENDL